MKKGQNRSSYNSQKEGQRGWVYMHICLTSWTIHQTFVAEESNEMSLKFRERISHSVLITYHHRLNYVIKHDSLMNMVMKSKVNVVVGGYIRITKIENKKMQQVILIICLSWLDLLFLNNKLIILLMGF